MLAGELAERADALAAAPDEAITLNASGRIVWAGSEIARLETGETALKPRIALIADEHLAGPDRERVLKRLEAWLEAELRGKIAPLMVLSEAADLSGLARGLAYQLTETLGVLRRETASAEIKALDQAARAQLRKYGVRFGAFNVYIPALLKPAAADLLLMLWALHSGREHGIDAGRSAGTAATGAHLGRGGQHPGAYWRAAGFHVAGTRAVRIDMLERLSDLIRARVAYRAAEGGVAPPTGATGDGGFRVAPELMSVVGCSGEEFCSILKALGFRRERRKLAPAPHSGRTAPEPGQESATARGCRRNSSTRSGGQESAERRITSATSGAARREASARGARKGAAARAAEARGPGQARGRARARAEGRGRRALALRRARGAEAHSGRTAAGRKLKRERCRGSGSTNGSGARGLPRPAPARRG